MAGAAIAPDVFITEFGEVAVVKGFIVAMLCGVFKSFMRLAG